MQHADAAARPYGPQFLPFSIFFSGLVLCLLLGSSCGANPPNPEKAMSPAQGLADTARSDRAQEQRIDSTHGNVDVAPDTLRATR